MGKWYENGLYSIEDGYKGSSLVSLGSKIEDLNGEEEESDIDMLEQKVIYQCSCSMIASH